MAYFYEPRGRRQPIFNAPAVAIGLIAILIFAHLARVLLPDAISVDVLFVYGFVPARYGAGLFPAHTPWLEQLVPFVSYMFLHGDWTHVLINSLWLLVFGAVVARRWGAPLFLAFFAVCGIAAALAYLAFNIGSASPVIGASGAISGLMAAGFRMIGAQEKLASLLDRRVLVWTAVWTAANVVTGLSGLGAGPGVHLVAWQAHLGGYFAGLFLAGLFDRFRPAIPAVPLPGA